MFPVRIWFTKRGRAKYISHLDLNRLFIRAFNRSGLNIWYTEGFNPHPFISFALPLSLGQESNCEIMDFKMNDTTPLETVKNTLNRALPEGIQVVFIAIPMLKAKEIGFAAYDVTLVSDKSLEACKALLLDNTPMVVTKKTKSSQSEIDLKDKFSSKEEDVIIQDNRLQIRLVLPAGAGENINPSLVVEALSAQTETVFTQTAIVRKVIYDKNGKEFK